MQFYSKEHEVKGKVALITGGVKNLGEATAKELARCGANLFLHYHSSKDRDVAEKLAKDLQSTYADIKVELYQGDLDKAEDLTSLFDAAKLKFPKGVDIAVNNVGMVLKKPIKDITEAEFDKMDNINNKTAFFFIKEASKNVNENGKIVSLVTSLLAAYTPFYAAYQGNKAGVEYYSKSASKELQSRGISVNCVAPGPMNTSFCMDKKLRRTLIFTKRAAYTVD